MALSLLTGVPTAWKPDTPCPLALSLSVFHILGCPLAASPPPQSPLAILPIVILTQYRHHILPFLFMKCV